MKPWKHTAYNAKRSRADVARTEGVDAQLALFGHVWEYVGRLNAGITEWKCTRCGGRKRLVRGQTTMAWQIADRFQFRMLGDGRWADAQPTCAGKRP